MPKPTRNPDEAANTAKNTQHQHGPSRARQSSAPAPKHTDTHAEKHDYSVKPFGRCGLLNPAAAKPGMRDARNR